MHIKYVIETRYVTVPEIRACLGIYGSGPTNCQSIWDEKMPDLCKKLLK